jgi:hypothetical protein
LNAAVSQFGSIGSLAHVGLGAKQLRGFEDCLLKTKMLKCVQRVVVNEYTDWPLSGEQVRCMFDHIAQSVQPLLP